MVSSLGKLLLLAGLTVVASARSPCACTREYRPVCGSDRITYSNPCTFKCAKALNNHLFLKHRGACANTRGKRSVNDDCIFKESSPVCGTDHITYDNPCLLKRAAETTQDLKIASQGPCKKPCACPKNYRPVCGSDGKTYGNSCTFQCAQNSDPGLTMIRKGRCASNRPCECPLDYNPVCGSDGETYNNQCILDCDKRSKPSLSVSREGSCEENGRTKRFVVTGGLCPCTKELHEVCGTNGVSYGNPCLLRCVAKENPGLHFAHEGRCKKG